eukprot:CAMPEP_0119517234 /NCGR_PEP_ID=MMETSP1344-20130328/34187_1 /TAXON_ID=236787 /ORGANISM="Florenciella parvula, Strain CCMP2471" /LENGTH=74 /DNA_ID=CAMNT_0007554803 /DNA_START=127 /DNA_END=348 /DNA_ORIENTATION=-
MGNTTSWLHGDLGGGSCFLFALPLPLPLAIALFCSIGIPREVSGGAKWCNVQAGTRAVAAAVAAMTATSTHPSA